MVTEVYLGKVGAVAARELWRFERNRRDCKQQVEMRRVLDTPLDDQEAIYAPHQAQPPSDIGRQAQPQRIRTRSPAPAYASGAPRKSTPVELAVVAHVEMDDQLEMDPDRRAQAAIKLAEIGSVRQTLFWLLEHKWLQVLEGHSFVFAMSNRRLQ